MSWTRIEVMGRSLGLDEGTQARIADPLWMLGRQWQVGELRGDDAARPAAVRATVGTAAVDRWRPAGATAARRLPSDVPLERLVEAMPPAPHGPAAAFNAAEAGARLLRTLRRAGLDGAADALVAGFAFAEPPPAVGLGPAAALTARVVSSRGLDGGAVAAASAARLDKVLAGLSADEKAAALNAIDAWRPEPATPDSWVDSRLGYRFSVGAVTDVGPVTLVADGHDGGPLDWYTFDIAPPRAAGGGAPGGGGPAGPEGPIDIELPDDIDPPDGIDRPAGTDRPGGPARPRVSRSTGAGKADLDETTVSVVPTNARYAGMPASRWWELEDGTVHFGDLDAGPSDLARLAVADFVTEYADDWFIVPVRIRTGRLARVTRLEVFDTMGGKTTIEPASTVDRRRAPDRTRAFKLFELAGDTPGEANRAPWLLVPAVLASTLEGNPLERVEFARDEGANLCWAVERLVEGPLGRAIDRARAWSASRPPVAPRADGGDGNVDTEERWEYRVESPTPPWWIPLIPQRLAATAETALRRARMRAWDDLDRALAGAHGAVLRPDRPLRVREEEVPANGVTVERRWQFARWHDGGVHSWLHHRTRPGRGERSSGITWDRLEPVRVPAGLPGGIDLPDLPGGIDLPEVGDQSRPPRGPVRSRTRSSRSG